MMNIRIIKGKPCNPPWKHNWLDVRKAGFYETVCTNCMRVIIND